MSDAFCERLLAEPGVREARQWLREREGNTLGEFSSTAASIRLVSRAYNLGAERVTAVEIVDYPELGGLQNTGRLVVTLPKDPAKRVAVLRWAGRIAEKRGFGGESDIGQAHVFLMLD